MIEQLDIPRKQVFVEAAMIEVTLEQSRSMGMSMHGGSPLDNGGMIVGSSAPGSLNSLTLLSLLSSGASLPSGLSVAAFGKNLTVPGTDGKVVIPSAGVLLSMLANDSNVNVLSTPNILTTDNQEAEIQVGQNIPIPTGQTVATGGLSSVSIERETVGVKLQITPQINESGTIRLDIALEISNAVPSSLGVNVNTLGVTTTLKTASTTVIIKDTQTIVIGGLMQDSRSESNDRTPLLGDIPVLGWLFKNAGRQKTKSNLIILLTPHIVRSDEEIDNMRMKFKKDYDSFIEESLGQEGKRWDDYFQSKYSGQFNSNNRRTETTIDLTGEKPKVIQGPTPPPGSNVQPGNTATGPAPSQDNNGTLQVNPLEGATSLEIVPEQPMQPQPAAPPKKKHWYDRKPKAPKETTKKK